MSPQSEWASYHSERRISPRATTTQKAVVSVRNLDFPSFEYNNLKNTLVYRGAAVGMGSGPPRRAGARRTTRVSVTLEVMTSRLPTRPGFESDLNVGFDQCEQLHAGWRENGCVFIVFEKKYREDELQYDSQQHEPCD